MEEVIKNCAGVAYMGEFYLIRFFLNLTSKLLRTGGSDTVRVLLVDCPSQTDPVAFSLYP